MTRFLNDVHGLLLRFVLYYQTMGVDKVLALGLPRIGGCILLDGDVGPRTAALSEPYVDDPACYGTLYSTKMGVCPAPKLHGDWAVFPRALLAIVSRD